MSFAIRRHEAKIVRTGERAVVCPATGIMTDARNQKPGTGPGGSQE